MPDKTSRQLEAEMLEKVDELIDCLMASGLATGDKRDQELKAGVDKIKQIADLFLTNYPQAVEYLDLALKEMVGQKLADPKLLTSFLSLSENLDEVIQEGLRQFNSGEQLPFEPDGLEKSGWLGTAPHLTLVDNVKRLETDLPAPVDFTRLNDSIEDAAGTTGESGKAGDQVERADQADQLTTSEGFEAQTKVNAETRAALDPLEWSLSVLYPGERRIANYTQGNRTVPWYLPKQKLAFNWRSVDQLPDNTDKRFWEQRGISLILLNEADLGNHRSVERQIRRQLR
jgi:hypothetical protein